MDDVRGDFLGPPHGTTPVSYEVSYASAILLRIKCDVPHPLPLNGKCHMFCSRENKQSRDYKISVHYDLQNSSMFPLEVNWNTYGTCVFQLMVYKVDM